MAEPEETIPEHQEGNDVNVQDSVQLSDEAEAKRFYAIVKERLLNVNGWKDLAGSLGADFHLTNDAGQVIDGPPHKGNYFKIDIPGPGILSGKGYDWVRIEEVQDESKSDVEFVAIRVRPAASPLNDEKDVAHFYSDEATSNFIVRREGTKVIVGVYGRNEKPNTNAETIVDKIRNVFVGTGAVAGFSKLQWKALVNGLLERR